MVAVTLPIRTTEVKPQPIRLSTFKLTPASLPLARRLRSTSHRLMMHQRLPPHHWPVSMKTCQTLPGRRFLISIIQLSTTSTVTHLPPSQYRKIPQPSKATGNTLPTLLTGLMSGLFLMPAHSFSIPLQVCGFCRLLITTAYHQI